MATEALADNNQVNQNADYRQMANAIRALAMDAVQKANSGHPGMPMGMADVATILFSKYLKFDPQNPTWADRDRFILSAGHGSMLLYALNYLTGYSQMSLEQLQSFRQMGALTAGHPEVMPSAGIEMTTGPLGQGIATATGFALAERILNAHFNDDLVDHRTYVIASDGDLMEGISHEGCALAGHLKLDKLVVLYDQNGISIDGSTDLSYSDDVRKRFEAYGWYVQEIDGHDYDQIDAALANAQTSNIPSIICCRTHIGYGSPAKQDTAGAHGAPLGDDEIEATRKRLEWPHAPFEIPADILQLWRDVGARNSAEFEEWTNRLNGNRIKDQFLAVMDNDVDAEVSKAIADAKAMFAADRKDLATRQSSGKTLEHLVPALPFLIGGSADLTGSNNTRVKGPEAISAENFKGQYVHYGVREHGMAACMNGMALHGGMIPYSGTFLCFSDYCRPSIRLAALMKQRVIHVMTHDSIGLGEDGPTHQPVEHVAALRAIPNTLVMRPGDAIEAAECWELALKNADGPSVMALTRQGLPLLRDNTKENLCRFGAYTLFETHEGSEPQVTLFASGSELSIIMDAALVLKGEGIKTRVVSVPCMDLFFEQDQNYIQGLICNDSAKIAVEAAIRQGWDAIIGAHGTFIGMNGFGESAPYKELYQHFGITKEAVIDAAKQKITA